MLGLPPGGWCDAAGTVRGRLRDHRDERLRDRWRCAPGHRQRSRRQWRAKMSADQATRAALAALTAASSVHVRGTFTADRRGERFDMRFEGNSASGSFTFKGAPVQTVTYGGSMYMKAGLTAGRRWAIRRIRQP